MDQRGTQAFSLPVTYHSYKSGVHEGVILLREGPLFDLRIASDSETVYVSCNRAVELGRGKVSWSSIWGKKYTLTRSSGRSSMRFGMSKSLAVSERGSSWLDSVPSSRDCRNVSVSHGALCRSAGGQSSCAPHYNRRPACVHRNTRPRAPLGCRVHSARPMTFMNERAEDQGLKLTRVDRPLSPSDMVKAGTACDRRVGKQNKRSEGRGGSRGLRGKADEHERVTYIWKPNRPRNDIRTAIQR